MSKAEVMVIMILFRDPGYRCLKHFYPEKACKRSRALRKGGNAPWAGLSDSNFS